jgi:hypothetical protein
MNEALATFHLLPHTKPGTNALLNEIADHSGVECLAELEEGCDSLEQAYLGR